jgi:phosphopantetheine--protein transferase-like protein
VCVSIAHSGDLAVAIAGAEPVGIDVEIVEHRDAGVEKTALTAAESALLDQIVFDADGDPQRARAEAFTRFWAAKEAVSKAEGTGLEGRPAAFVVAAVEGEQLRVICDPDAREYVVDTTVVSAPAASGDMPAAYVVAWTRSEAARFITLPANHGGTRSCETTAQTQSSPT